MNSSVYLSLVVASLNHVVTKKTQCHGNKKSEEANTLRQFKNPVFESIQVMILEIQVRVWSWYGCLSQTGNPVFESSRVTEQENVFKVNHPCLWCTYTTKMRYYLILLDINYVKKKLYKRVDVQFWFVVKSVVRN